MTRANQYLENCLRRTQFVWTRYPHGANAAIRRGGAQDGESCSGDTTKLSSSIYSSFSFVLGQVT
jgi:hypothetical protein